MNYILENVQMHRSTYPDANDPEVASRMLTLDQYLNLARRIICRFAPPGFRNSMLKSEDAISFVAEKIMRGDWNYKKERNAKISTHRGECGKFAILDYIDNMMRQRKTVSLDFAKEHGMLDECISYHSPFENPEDETDRTTSYLNTLTAVLTPMQKQCIEMHYMLEMSPANIAEQIGVTRPAVHNAITEGMKAMRRSAGIAA